MTEERKQQILAAITRELERQTRDQRPGAPRLSEAGGAHRYAVNGEIDAIALATAVDAALGADTLEAEPDPASTEGGAGPGSSPKGVYERADEGKTPDELNAANDE